MDRLKLRPQVSEHTVVVGADLEGPVTAHDETGLAVLEVLEEANITSTALLPLTALPDELEKLGAHLEELLLGLLVGLGLDLLGQVNDGLEVDILGLGSLLVLGRECIRILSLT